MKSIQQQKGMGTLGWIAVLALIAFTSLLVLKLAPVYMNSLTINSILSGMEEDQDLGTKSPGEVKAALFKRMNVNRITDVDIDEVFIEQTKDNIVVEVDYEVRNKFIANVDFVISFHKKAEIPRR